MAFWIQTSSFSIEQDFSIVLLRSKSGKQNTTFLLIYTQFRKKKDTYGNVVFHIGRSEI